MRAYRRMFRSQTSDDMGRWKSRGGKSHSQRRRRAEERRLAPEGRKVGSLKRRVRSHLARWEMAVVARSTFASEKLKNTSRLEHFWKLGCRKSARRCGAKHISKSECTKHTRFWALLEVVMLKKCTPRCGAKHISKSECTKHPRFWTFLEVVMSKKCTPLWREAHLEVKTYKTHPFSDWKLTCRKSAGSCGLKHMSKSKVQ